MQLEAPMTFPYRYLTIFFCLLALSVSADAAERLRASYAAPNASQSPLWAAQARGYFAKYGLEVDLLYITSGSLNVQALVRNTPQFDPGGAGGAGGAPSRPQATHDRQSVERAREQPRRAAGDQVGRGPERQDRRHFALRLVDASGIKISFSIERLERRE